MAKIMSLVMTIFMVVPILAPSIGQGILFIAPWEWVFGTLTVAAIIVLVWTVFRLPETLSPDAHMPLDPQSMLRAYGQILRTPVTLGYMCASGVIFGSLFAFIGSAEQIFSEVFDQEETFPLWFAGVAFMLSVANFTNSRLVERLGMRRLSHCAMVGFTATSLFACLGDDGLWRVAVDFLPPLCDHLCLLWIDRSQHQRFGHGTFGQDRRDRLRRYGVRVDNGGRLHRLGGGQPI